MPDYFIIFLDRSYQDIVLYSPYPLNQSSMKDKTITEPLYLHIQEEINKTERKGDFYRALFYSSRIIQILLGAAVTLIAGLWQNTNALLITGTAITCITAVETLFHFEDKKSTYKVILFELREIRSEIIYLLLQKPKLDEKDLAYFFQKYKGIKATARELIEKEKEDVGAKTGDTIQGSPSSYPGIA